MASIGDVTRPAFAYDQATDTWVPVGIGPHTHTAASVNAVATSSFAAKGDLLVGTGAGTLATQTVGANGTVLTADSAEADGVKWATPASGSMTLLSTTTLTGSSVVISSISQAYKDLRFVLRGFRASGTADMYFKFNNATTEPRGFVGVRGNGGTASTWIGTGTAAIELAINLGTGASGTENSCVMTIFNYTETTGGRAFSIGSGFVDNTPSNASLNVQGGFCGTGTTALTSISISLSGGTFSAGTIQIYGVN